MSKNQTQKLMIKRLYLKSRLCILYRFVFPCIWICICTVIIDIIIIMAIQQYDTKQCDGEVLVILKLWGMWRTLSLPSLAGPFCNRVVAPDRVLSMGKIEINCVLMLNRITWNRTVLISQLRTHAKLNCLKWNCFCMQNRIVWNRTALIFKLRTYAKLNCLK